MILDSLKQIETLDKSDAFGQNFRATTYLQQDFGFKQAFEDVSDFAIIGMGGSSLAADYLPSYPSPNKPMQVFRDYGNFVGISKNTLAIVCSYSGNTEESLEALTKVLKITKKVVIVAQGGKLLEAAIKHKIAYIELPKVAQPRFAAFYFYRAYCEILQASGLVPADTTEKLTDESNWAYDMIANLHYTVPTTRNPAKKLALELCGKTVIVYGSSEFKILARKFKICINENAKQLAWWNEVPEMCHNEFIGWAEQPQVKNFGVVNITSHLDHPRVQKRFTVMKKILSGMMPMPEEVVLKGDNILQQLIWGTVFLDHVALYLSILNGLDPSPVGLVEKLKKSLDD